MSDDDKEPVKVFKCGPDRNCKHEWNGPWVRVDREEGRTCSKCGEFFGNWILWEGP